MTTRKEKAEEFGRGYNVIVTGRHVHVTEGMREHAVQRISRLDHIADRIVDVHITMDIQKMDHRVDILLKYGHTLIRSHAVSDDMYVSIDEAVHKLESQLKKYKNKLHDYHKKAHPITEIPVAIYAPIDEEETPESFHHVVATEHQKLRILTEDEAIMKMEFSLEPVMVYRSEDSGDIRVIYRRPDGNYGIIYPDK